jgi:formylmethanofuran dehydrogenase subunit B
MDSVKVRRSELIDRISENRDAHKALYEKAVAGFRAPAIEELDDMLTRAKGGEVRLNVGLTVPEDHTHEYDRALDMLNMSQDDVIEIDKQSFAQLVRNEWTWFRQALHTNSTYASGNKLGGSR